MLLLLAIKKVRRPHQPPPFHETPQILQHTLTHRTQPRLHRHVSQQRTHRQTGSAPQCQRVNGQ
jgi:hypothetical protein